MSARFSRRLGSLTLLCSIASSGQAQTLVPTTFTDTTTQAGLSAFYVHGPGWGINAMNISLMGGGVAIADYDKNGWPDIYVVSGGAFPDQLYLNRGDGTFTDRAQAAGVDYAHMGMGASAGDFDGDGWVDIYVTSEGASGATPAPGKHILWKNNGDGTFTNVAVAAGVNLTSPTIPTAQGSTFGDYDLDGDLDLFVAAWTPNADGSRLFQNDGDGTFTDVTVPAGAYQSDMRGFSPHFLDMDGDRYPELLVASDFGTSRYFINNTDGTFTEATVASGLGLDGNGMGQCCGDFDGDGLFEWYVTSIHSLDPGATNIPGTGNMLYHNLGGHNYAEVSVAAGVNDGGWGWGTVAVDFNNDGLLDIAENNGFKQFNGLGVQEWIADPCYLWLNQGDGTFHETALASGITTMDTGRGLINFDYDGDGDQDLLVINNEGRHNLYRNDLPQEDSSWLQVELDTSASPYLAPNGLGTNVVVDVNGTKQHRCIDGSCSYLSTSEQLAHFGLAGSALVDELTIEWSNGRSTRLRGIEANQRLKISFCPADWNGINGLSPEDLSDYVNDWLAGDADFNSDGVTDVVDLAEFNDAYTVGCP